MIIKAGHTIKEIRLGGKVIGKVMRGGKVVYQRSRLDTTPSLSFAAAGGSQVLSIDCAAGQVWTLSGLPAGWSVSAASGTGPAEVTITAPNNTSTQAVAGTITVASADKTATCTLSQAAGAKVYELVKVNTFSYEVIPAGGGTVSPSLSYSQEWTWNGVVGSGGRLASGASIFYSGSGVDASTGAVSAASKGTTVSGQTTVTTATATVTMNGKVGVGSASVYQAANTKVLTGLAIEKNQPDAAWQSPDHWNDIGAHGGNFLAVSGYMDYVFSSEATSRELYSSSHYKSILGQDDGLTLDPSATSWVEYYPPGGLRIKERGTTVGGARKGSVSWTYEGMTSNSIGFTQEANVVVGIAYATPTVSLAVADIPAAGGSVGSGEVTYSQEYSIAYSSYATEQPAPLTSGGTVSYSPAVSAGSLGTTVKARTSVGNLNVTVTMNGKVGVGSAPVYQAANAVTGYSDIAIQGVVYNAIPAAGGSVAPSIVAVHTKNFSSGASASEEPGFPPGYSLHFTISGSVFSIDASTGSVSVGANAGTSSRSALVVAALKDPGGTQVASKTVTVRQEAKPGPVTVTLSAAVTTSGQVQLNISPQSYDALSVHLMGYDTYGNVWSEVRNIGVGVTSDSFYPKEAATGFAADATIESVDNGSLSPYTTENAIYRWGENTFE